MQKLLPAHQRKWGTYPPVPPAPTPMRQCPGNSEIAFYSFHPRWGHSIL